MATPNYKSLFSVLIKVTKAKMLPWNREKINRRLFSSTDPNKNKILLEQYYAEGEGNDVPCINMTIFKENDEIINEIVLCESSYEADEYKLLCDLYLIVEQTVSVLENEKPAPLIKDITESIQKLVAH